MTHSTTKGQSGGQQKQHLPVRLFHFFTSALVKNFSGKGLVSDIVASSPEFLTAVGIGADLTVFLAALTGFPISTTHSLTGALTLSTFLYGIFHRIRTKIGFEKELCVCVGEKKQLIPVAALSGPRRTHFSHNSLSHYLRLLLMHPKIALSAIRVGILVFNSKALSTVLILLALELSVLHAVRMTHRKLSHSLSFSVDLELSTEWQRWLSEWR